MFTHEMIRASWGVMGVAGIISVFCVACQALSFANENVERKVNEERTVRMTSTRTNASRKHRRETMSWTTETAGRRFLRWPRLLSVFCELAGPSLDSGSFFLFASQAVSLLQHEEATPSLR